MKPMKPMTPMKPMRPLAPMDDPASPAWWPEGLGRPDASGSADDTSYAYFADKRRLAVREAGRVRVFDTGRHDITGIASDSRDGLRFGTAGGSVELSALKEV